MNKIKILILIVILGAIEINAQTTRLSNAQCGGSVSSMGSNITCNLNLGSGHRFEISRLDGGIVGVYDAIAANAQFPTRSRYTMRFSWMTQCAIGFNETYRIRVAWFNGSTWSAYGQYCEINTPSSALRLSDAFCGATVSEVGQNVTTVNNFKCGHRFEVRTLDNTLVTVYDALAGSIQSPSRSPYIFRFSYLPSTSIVMGSTYRIRVAYFDDQLNTWSDYGESCTLSTPGQLVSISPSLCGTVIPSLGSNIFTNVTFGSGYRFEVRRTNETLVGVYDALAAQSQFPNRSPYLFRFSFMPQGSILLNTIYRIRVSWFNPETNQWSPYGTACDIQTPGTTTTELTEAWCDNNSIPSEFTNLVATPVTGVSQYFFTITSPDYGAITTLAKNTNTFQLNELPNPHPIVGVPYFVTVRTRINDDAELSLPGITCSVQLAPPTTVITNSNCGRSYNYLIQDSVFAVPVSGAQMYRYRLIDQESSAVLLDTVNNRTTYNGISLAKFPGIQYGRTYRISVATRVNGIWGNYGDECTITTVAVPLTELRPGFCNTTVASCGTNIYAREILYATQLQFQIIGSGVNEVYQNPNGNIVFRLTWLSQASQVQYGETFNVRCRVFVNGEWTPWGNTCAVTLAQPNSRLTSLCNGTIPTWGTNVVTSAIGCASDYRFLFNGPGMNDVIFNPTNFTNQFRPNQLVSLGMVGSSTYSVRVSVLASGQWSPWGDACNITTPPPTSIIPNNEITELVFDEISQLNEVATTTELEKINISYQISPNPFNNNFKLIGFNLPMEKIKMVVVDNAGRIVFEECRHYTDLTEGILIGDTFSKGIYTIQLSTTNSNLTYKVVKSY